MEKKTRNVEVFSLLILILHAVVSFSSRSVNLETSNPASKQTNSHTVGMQNPTSAFRTYMLGVISTFPIAKQCTILTAILKDSGKDPSSFIQNILATTFHRHLPCFPITKFSETPASTTELRTSTEFYISRLFDALPLAFQCKVVSDVTLTSRGNVTQDDLHSEMIEVASELSEALGIVRFVEKCTKLTTQKVVTNAYVEIGVRLRKKMPLDAWTERFRKILPKIYLTHVSRKGKIAEFVSGWKTNERGAKIPILSPNQFVVKILDHPIVGGNVAMVSFSFYSRTKSGYYQVIDGDEIAASLAGLDPSVLDSYIQAEVIGWRTHGKRNHGKFESVRMGKTEGSKSEILRLQMSFPKYLVRYFKSLKTEGRCYILLQISTHINRELLLIEKQYHNMDILPKKYFCSSPSKHDQRPKNRRPNALTTVWQFLDEFIRKPKLSSITPKPATNTTVIHTTRPLNTMEIVLFVLLGFLCLLIMVFIANCVVFTFKTKQLSVYSSKHDEAKYVFGAEGPNEIDSTSSESEITAKSLCETPGFGKKSKLAMKNRLLSETSDVTTWSETTMLTDIERERVSTV